MEQQKQDLRRRGKEEAEEFEIGNRPQATGQREKQATAKAKTKAKNAEERPEEDKAKKWSQAAKISINSSTETRSRSFGWHLRTGYENLFEKSKATAKATATEARRRNSSALLFLMEWASTHVEHSRPKRGRKYNCVNDHRG